MTTTSWTSVDSPVGALLLTSDGRALTRVLFTPWDDLVLPGWRHEEDAVLREARRQLDDYFAGNRTDFTLPVAPAGTDFQLRVWALLREIPYARTISYGELARRVGNPAASRAVGLANGRNPISVVVPCHRVIGASGALTGYGGGLDRKRLLLDLERRVAGPTTPTTTAPDTTSPADQLTLL